MTSLFCRIPGSAGARLQIRSTWWTRGACCSGRRDCSCSWWRWDRYIYMKKRNYMA